MIPSKGTHPELNVVFIGACLIKILRSKKDKKFDILDIYAYSVKELDISIEHVILGLDWLYMTSIIRYEGKKVFINENY